MASGQISSKSVNKNGKVETGLFLSAGFLHLTVLAADEAITEAPSNVTATLGEDVALPCRTHLELHRHMSWVRLTEDAIVELAQVGNGHKGM